MQDKKTASPFYSRKSFQPTITPHMTLLAAQSNAGDFGHVWITSESRHYQVFRKNGGGWIMSKPDPHFTFDFQSELKKQNLID